MNKEFSQHIAHASNVSHHSALVLKASHQS